MPGGGFGKDFGDFDTVENGAGVEENGAGVEPKMLSVCENALPGLEKVIVSCEIKLGAGREKVLAGREKVEPSMIGVVCCRVKLKEPGWAALFTLCRGVGLGLLKCLFDETTTITVTLPASTIELASTAASGK